MSRQPQTDAPSFIPSSPQPNSTSNYPTTTTSTAATTTSFSKRTTKFKLAKYNVMRWFKRKKPKAKLSHSDETSTARDTHHYDRRAQNGLASHRTPPTVPVSRRTLEKLPAAILERIFAFVCPHTQDESYESCEQSAVEDTCMLCDLRDLSHCAQASKKWREAAYNVMFRSIRIDAVHYCDLEDILAEKRKRRSYMRSNAEPEDTPTARLRYLYRTLAQDRAGLASKVEYLKIPYMTREAAKADLARAVSLLPNLRFVDLPDGLYHDDPSCNVLKLELQARCPDLRKMSYMGGGERMLELLQHGRAWRNLEVVELSKLKMDPTIMRQSLGALPNLRALKATDMPAFNDDMFKHSDYMVDFPALTELIFENIPNITTEGLCNYLLRSDSQEALTVLILKETGVHPSTVQQILLRTPNLKKLSMTETVSTSFPAANNVPVLQSKSLQILHYEISKSTSANAYASTVSTYYSYLASSLIMGGLPALLELYVRDPEFPELLLDLAPPSAPFVSDPDNYIPPLPDSYTSPPKNRFSSNNPFGNAPQMPTGPGGLKQELEIYSKGLDEMEWIVSKYLPPKKSGRRGSATTPRPVSLYGISNEGRGTWNEMAGARKSVIVGNGFGGFLSVPADGSDSYTGRPSSSAGEQKSSHRKRPSQSNLWR